MDQIDSLWDSNDDLRSCLLYMPFLAAYSAGLNVTVEGNVPFPQVSRPVGLRKLLTEGLSVWSREWTGIHLYTKCHPMDLTSHKIGIMKCCHHELVIILHIYYATAGWSMQHCLHTAWGVWVYRGSPTCSLLPLASWSSVAIPGPVRNQVSRADMWSLCRISGSFFFFI